MRRTDAVRWWVALGALALAACARQETREKPPTPVRLQAAEAAAAGGGVRYSANIVAKDQVSLAFKQAGYVREIMQVRGVDGLPRDLHDGDRVTQGTVLARLRETDYEETVRQVRSSVGEAKALLLQARQAF